MADAPCAGVSDRMLDYTRYPFCDAISLALVPINCTPWSGKLGSARVYKVKGAIYAINNMDMCV